MSRVFPGVVRQNGYVVGDVDSAMQSWLAVGVGPWFVLRELRQDAFRFRGQPSEPSLTVAFANSGALQIELIQQHNEAPSAYREFLGSGREGYHHVAFWASDFAAAVRAATDAGWSVMQEGGGATRFAYFDAPEPVGVAVELSELTGGTGAFNEMIAATAAGWDGATDPIRTVRPG